MTLNSSPEDGENKDPPDPESSLRPYQNVSELKLFEVLDAYSGPVRLGWLWEMMQRPQPGIPLEAALDELRHRVFSLTGQRFQRLERKIWLVQEASLPGRRLPAAAESTIYQKIDALMQACDARFQVSGWDDPPAREE